MVKIRVHLPKLSQNENRGIIFLDHSIYGFQNWMVCDIWKN